MYTLNNIVSLLRSFATTHGQINDFEFQPEFRVGTERQLLYPLLSCDVTGNALGELTDNSRVDDELEFEFRMIDLVKPDISNETEVLSDCLSMMKDLITYLRQTQFAQYMDISTAVNIEPVRYVSPDDTAGWMTKIKIKQGLDLDLCAIP